MALCSLVGVDHSTTAVNSPVSSAAQGISSKLCPRYLVPFVITEFTTPVLVRPMDPEGKANARAHVFQLKPASVRCVRLLALENVSPRFILMFLYVFCMLPMLLILWEDVSPGLIFLISVYMFTCDVY